MVEPSPIAQLVLFAMTALLVRRILTRGVVASAAAGSIVMAIGIFALAAMQQMPAIRTAVMQPLAVGLLVIWVFLASSYAACCLRGRLRDHARPLIGRFAIGTWVAATAVLIQVMLLAMPGWRSPAAILALIAFAIWLWFLKIVAEAVRALFTCPPETPIPGVVLLATVSTQSLALAALDLLPGHPTMRLVATGLIAAGALFYLAGVALIVWSHAKADGWTLVDDWDNTNCILHGAMSITGLAAVAWDIASPGFAVGLWLYVFAVFLAVEGVEIARLVARVGVYGWRLGAFTYRVTQWSRNFTLGMFYAFTLALSQRLEVYAEPSWIRVIQKPILSYGPYVVLALLLVETGLCLEAYLDRGDSDLR